MTSVPATASYDNHNQVTWVANSAPTGFTYDAAGNVLSDNVNRYLYDGEGRLCAYQNIAVPGNYGPMIGYVYGPDGLRVGKGTIATWTCNPLTAGFAMTASYVLGPGGEQASEMAVTGTYGNYSSSWQHTNVFANGSLLATYSGTETYFALSDWLGTKRAEITPDGQSTRFFELPYGNGLTSIGSLTDATEQHFTGKERDSETGEANGNDYFGARYYASSMGRFFSPDPGWMFAAAPSNPQSWNEYEYTMNNPLIFRDLDGYDCVYLNDSGTDVDRDQVGRAIGIDQHSNLKECRKNGGYWVDGTFTHGTVFSNSDDVQLSGYTMDSNGNRVSTDAYWTNATGGNSDLIAAMGYTGLTGTVDLVHLYQNRPNFASIGPMDRFDVWSGCIAGGAPQLVLDFTPFGIVPDAVKAMQSDSLKPLFNSGDRLENTGNAVDLAEKTAKALEKTLPLAGEAGKVLGPAAIAIGAVKYGRDTYDCAH